MLIIDAALFVSTIAIFLISLTVHEYAHAREARAAYGTFSQFGMLILIVFLVFGGLRIIVYPVVGFLYTLLRLPLSSLVT